MKASAVTIEDYNFICSCIYDSLFFEGFFFTINNEHIHKCFLKSLCLLLLFHLLFRNYESTCITVESLKDGHTIKRTSL